MVTATASQLETQSTPKPAAKPKKMLVRRLAADRSQLTRMMVQFAFLMLNGFLGVEFFLWVRYFESNGATMYVTRPSGVDGWLPIAGLINFRYFLATRHIPDIHPAALVLFAVFVAASMLLKKVFCSWLCPVGTVSEYLWKLGRKVFRRNLNVPRWLDFTLRVLKYILLGFFVYIVFAMPVDSLVGFMMSPFGLVADVKMLNFFRTIGTVGLAVIMTLVALSVVIQNFWCRYLCPYGALMGIVSVLSPVKIRRDAAACIDCGKCDKACPSHLPVDQLVQICSVECTACMECIAVCPAENALQFSLAPRNASAAETLTPEGIAARWKGPRSETLDCCSNAGVAFLRACRRCPPHRPLANRPLARYLHGTGTQRRQLRALICVVLSCVCRYPTHESKNRFMDGAPTVSSTCKLGNLETAFQ